METRFLGKSNLAVTPMGLGLAALGRPGYINLGHGQDLPHNYEIKAMENHAHSVLDEAWLAGVRYFDAARSYGRAEPFLASWLMKRSISPDQITIGSKWGYTYTAGWRVQADKHEIKELSLPNLKKQFTESHSLLKRHLKLYQIHSATLESRVLDDQAVLDELNAIRQKGVLIGLSVSGPNQAKTLRKALSIQVNGRLLFDAVQATWNLLERSAGDMLAEASNAGMGIIIKEALANGRLTARNKEPTFSANLSKLTEIAREKELTIDALALTAVLAQPWADIVLSGAATVPHLKSNLSAVNSTWDKELAHRLRTLIEPPDLYWAKRSNLDWN